MTLEHIFEGESYVNLWRFLGLLPIFLLIPTFFLLGLCSLYILDMNILLDRILHAFSLLPTHSVNSPTPPTIVLPISYSFPAVRLLIPWLQQVHTHLGLCTGSYFTLDCFYTELSPDSKPGRKVSVPCMLQCLSGSPVCWGQHLYSQLLVSQGNCWE